MDIDNRTIRDGLDEEDPSNYLALKRVLEKQTKRHGNERLYNYRFAGKAEEIAVS
jgi:hypothetical protein